MDRPSRKTKVVNYCEAKDFDDDEDFACSKAPPCKKPREDVKQQEHKKSSSKSSHETNSVNEKSRTPLDEKLHERDLEAAITLSMLNNVDGIKDKSLGSNEDVKVQLPPDENTDPTSMHFSNCSVDIAVLGLDEISSERESSAMIRKAKSSINTPGEQRKRVKEEDEDYEPKLTPESDDDFSAPESDDEEFTVKKVSKMKKEKVAKNEKTKGPPASKRDKQPTKASKHKSQAPASTPVRSPPAAKSASKRPASSSPVYTSKPAASLSPAGGRIPKWNPPGQIGKSPTSSQSPAVKSPGQGLRLGLSRLVRVKSLHPSVASH